MKNDCPHCHKSMTGRFLQWSKLAHTDRARTCPLCGASIEYQIHPEEMASRVLSIAIAVGGAYWAHHRGEGYFAILLMTIAALAALFAVAAFRLRDKQRFRKAGFAGSR
jgi:hypothetical protein